MPSPSGDGRTYKADAHCFHTTESQVVPFMRILLDGNGIYPGLPGYHIRTEHFDYKAGATLPLPFAKKDTSSAGAPVTDFVTDASAGHYNMALAADTEAEILTLYHNDNLSVDPDLQPIIAVRLKINPDVTGATGQFNSGTLVVGLGSAQNDTPDSVARNAWIRINNLGTGTGYLVNNDPGPYAVGATAITVDTGSGTIVAGDRVVFEDDTTVYRVTGTLAANVFSITSDIATNPGLQATLANNKTVTVVPRALYLEVDDATTDTDDRDSLVNWANDTWMTLVVDMTDLASVKFYVYTAANGWKSLNRGAAISAAAMTGSAENVQPYIQLQKASSANNDHSILIDKIWVAQKEA